VISREKIWVQNKMPVTNVNRLAREIEEAQAKLKIFHNKPRSIYGSTLKDTIAQRNEYQKAVQKVINLTEKLKTMNQGALQVQLAKIENRRKNIRKNLNKIMEGYGIGKNELIQNVFGEYSHWYLRQDMNDPKKQANKIRNLEAKIERLPTATNYNRRKKAVAKLAIQQAKIGINERALKKAVNLRKKHLGPDKPARNKFRSIVKQRVLRNNIRLGPSGTLTLEPRRRFPGFKEPTLENLARCEREKNRLLLNIKTLQNALARRNNNNRHN